MSSQLTKYSDLKVGQKASVQKKITEDDISSFIEITGDANPLHVDALFAEQTFFGQKIAHGMLSASLFSTLVGMHIPGTGAIYKSQTLEFLRPVFIGDTLIAWFEIVAIDPEKERIEIKSWIENQDGQKVVAGRAVTSLLRGLKNSNSINAANYEEKMSRIDLSGLKIGMENTLSIVVSNENSAEAVGYKGMPVLGTPHLVGIMETACIFVHEFLPENCLTVGISNSMKHLAPSPIGTTVTAKARLRAIEGRKLTFDVEAHDSVEKVAEGTHTRFIIDSRNFFANIEKKKQKLGLV